MQKIIRKHTIILILGLFRDGSDSASTVDEESESNQNSKINLGLFANLGVRGFLFVN